ncbi:putative ribonuclease H-like domain-containing protein [Tanacetum coccineum]|uniref:Ribonuclease H-like domain-containing protein n=1 Tax=Tanacetum coccineum TaxID=301880 RepID=A0ABQ4Y0D9_9ASTR
MIYLSKGTQEVIQSSWKDQSWIRSNARGTFYNLNLEGLGQVDSYLNGQRGLGQNGYSKTRKMREELLLETREDWLHKVTPKKKALIMMRFLTLVVRPRSNQCYFWPMALYMGIHCVLDGCKEGLLICVEKALYGLHQAPRARYETLSTCLLENGFRRGTIDKTLFIKKDQSDIMLVQVYVDDIIFGSTKKTLCLEFEQMMHKRFQMSSMGELNFFLGLKVQQKEDGIFIRQDKYVADILKKFDYVTVKIESTPMEPNKALVKNEEVDNVDRIFRYLKGQPKLGRWYPRDSPFNLEAFSNSDYAGVSLDRKSTTGGVDPTP